MGNLSKAVAGEEILPRLSPRAVLANGGVVLFLRHGQTDNQERDNFPVNLADCRTQRNLSDIGKVTAAAIGRAFQESNAKVDHVWVSPFCRTKETAALAFKKFDEVAELSYSFPDDPQEKSRKAAWLRARLSSPVPLGHVDVIISHTTNLQDAAKHWPSHEGDALVFKPEGGASWRLMGKVYAEDWTHRK